MVTENNTGAHKVEREEFAAIRSRHNGANYLLPSDLTVTSVKPRRILLVGSCLADTWQSRFGTPCDFVLTNNLAELPPSPPQPIEEYDLQIIQMSLRSVASDLTLFPLSFLEPEKYQEAFDFSLGRMSKQLAIACRWNIEHGLLTFVSNFLVPQQNAMGRFAPRYDLRNFVYYVEQLNFHLDQEIKKYKNAYLLDIDQIAAVAGRQYIQDDHIESQTHASVLGEGFFPKDLERIEPPRRMGEHYTFHGEAFIQAVCGQALSMYKMLVQDDAVKLAIFDLDNTLWRGVVAEEGVHDQLIDGWPLGVIEALAFLKKRGILLAIASKNDEKRIRELWPQIMRKRITLDDFAVVKINWESKAKNVEEILKTTHILPKNSLFVDDNPVEREAIQKAYPSMRVIGKYPYFLKRVLLWSAETQVPFITEESARRTEMVRSQESREMLRNETSREDFLASLEVKVTGEEIMSTDHPSFKRAFELLNKTNQFNTTGRRWTMHECEAYFKAGSGFYAVRVEDKFTDHGLAACALVALNVVDQFVMSCRVLGMDIEHKVIDFISAGMKSVGASEIKARLIETEANFPCRDLYSKTGFVLEDGGLWCKPL